MGKRLDKDRAGASSAHLTKSACSTSRKMGVGLDPQFILSPSITDREVKQETCVKWWRTTGFLPSERLLDSSQVVYRNSRVDLSRRLRAYEREQEFYEEEAEVIGYELHNHVAGNEIDPETYASVIEAVVRHLRAERRWRSLSDFGEALSSLAKGDLSIEKLKDRFGPRDRYNQLCHRFRLRLKEYLAEHDE